jgi:hypothetical protein
MYPVKFTYYSPLSLLGMPEAKIVTYFMDADAQNSTIVIFESTGAPTTSASESYPAPAIDSRRHTLRGAL